MHNKLESLKTYLTEKQGLLLAFSGGIDSTMLLYLCKDLNITAVTFKSVFQTEEEISLTKDLCKKYNVKQEIIDFFPLQDELIRNNPKDRCYLCKKMMFTKVRSKYPDKTIIDGTNFDDLSSFRPGLKALKELKIISPLAEHKITKAEIREFARDLDLPNHNKPSTPCLATRFPYNIILTEQELRKVEAGEAVLKSAGFDDVRLRLHGDIARIELPKSEFKKIINNEKTLNKLKSLGIRYITLDLEGLRRGSMD